MYKFVLLKGWERQLLCCLDDNNPESKPSLKIYEHPFTELPYLKSHLRPQFAIFDAGFKLKQRTLEEQQDILNDDIVFIMDLYDAWTAVLPEGHDQDQSYNCPIEPSHENDDDDVGFVVDDDQDSDSDYDDKRRKRQKKVPCGKPKRKRQKVLSVPSRHQLISEITLSRLEQLGRAGWTRNMIRKWLRKSKYKAQSSRSSHLSH